jgi:hypothetical protein
MMLRELIFDSPIREEASRDMLLFAAHGYQTDEFAGLV